MGQKPPHDGGNEELEPSGQSTILVSAMGAGIGGGRSTEWFSRQC